MKHIVSSMVLITGLAAVSVASPPAHALEFVAAGSTACTGATWSDERALLKTPQALVNESNQPVLVTCSVPTYSLQLPPNNSYVGGANVLFFNRNAKTVSVTCQAVAVTAHDDYYLADQEPVTFAIGPHQGLGRDFGALAERNARAGFAVGCTLPPHVEIQKLVGSVHEWRTGILE